MSAGPSYEIVLTKEDFKFSVAHFTVFGPTTAEVLHGHNYSVSVRVAGESTDNLGLLLDLSAFKTEIRRVCGSLDSRTLVPTECPLVEVGAAADAVDVRFGDLAYRLASESVVLLPIRNTSIEELALYFWQQLAPSLSGTRARGLSVEVAETAGQSCAYVAPLSSEHGVSV
ncbi:MAG: 6-carboxytetrahydropterin synthase [Acidobacteriota bacterium]|nr:6-carboxytetrahydropterin synthase [Acidobacteriota bacterium]